MPQAKRPVLISVVQYLDALETGQVTIFDVIETARRLGGDGVELRREVWPNQDAELAAARARIDALGLQVTYATFSTLFNDTAAGAEQLYRDIDTAAALGAPLFRVFQGPAPAADDAPGWAAGQAVIDYANSKNVVIALENYARTPGNTLAEIQRVLDRLPGPGLATNIDIGNYYNNNQDNFEAIAAIGHRAMYAHLKDIDGNDLTYLGGGLLPMAELIAALDNLPQNIIYCFEFRGGDDPESRITKSLEFLNGRQPA